MQLDNPTLRSSRFTALYQPVADLRKRVFELEDAFSRELPDEFLSPELQPIPDEAPANIPRISFESTHGYTNLELTPVRVDLKTQYDEHYNRDIAKCLDYVSTKSEAVELALEVLKPELAFVALAVSARWSLRDHKDDEALRYLRNQLLSESFGGDKLNNLQLNYSLEVNDKLFKVITAGNYRVFRSDGPPVPHPRFKTDKMERIDHGLEKEIEINDRSAYNMGRPSDGTAQLETFIEYVREEIAQPIST